MSELDFPEKENLQKFLKLFNYERITLSVQPEKGTKSKYVDTTNFGAIQRTNAFTPDELFSKSLRKELLTQNDTQKAIYFMVNEGNGKASGGNTNCAKKENVQVLQALFIDTDNCPLSTVLNYLKQPHIDLVPHAIVKTSPKRYHLYILIDPVSPNKEDINRWRSIQKCFYVLGDPESADLGVDKTTADINQVLRLPSFFHTKDKESINEVKVTKISNHKPYDLYDVYMRTNAERFQEETEQGTSSFTPFNYPEPNSLGRGNRRQSLLSYIAHLIENILPIDAPEKYYQDLISQFVLTYFEQKYQKDYLPNGKMRRNIEQAFKDLKRGRQNKLYEQDAIAAQSAFEEQEAEELNSLPDEFYLNFPGGIGKVTRNISSFYYNLPVEFCFAAGLAVAGFTKAYTHRFMGAWPMLNGIMIGATASGKSTLIRAVHSILKDSGLLNPLSGYIDEPSTVQWLHSRLYQAGGIGFTMLDEAGDFVKALSSWKSSSFQTAIRKYIKESTTGGSEGARITVGGSIMSDLPPIERGLLSVWMFLQPSMFETSFNANDLADGLLGRFLQFKGKAKIDFTSTNYNLKDVPKYEPSLEVRSWIEMITRNLGDIREDAIKIAIAEKVEEIQDAMSKDEDGKKKKRVPRLQKESILRIAAGVSYKLKQDALDSPNIVQLKASDSAIARIEQYLARVQRNARKIQRKDEEDGRLAILARVQEMLHRMLAATCDKKVELEHVEACITFLTFQMQRFFGDDYLKITENYSERGLKAVRGALERAMKFNPREWITLREVNQAMAGRDRTLVKDVEATLKKLVSSGEVTETERPHKRKKNLKVKCYLITPSENPLDIE